MGEEGEEEMLQEFRNEVQMHTRLSLSQSNEGVAVTFTHERIAAERACDTQSIEKCKNGNEW